MQHKQPDTVGTAQLFSSSRSMNNFRNDSTIAQNLLLASHGPWPSKSRAHHKYRRTIDMLASSTLCSLQPWALKSCKSNPTALKSPKFSTSHGCSRLLRFGRVSCSKMKGLRIPNATTSTFLMCLDPFCYPKSSIGSVLTLFSYQIKPNKKMCMQSLCISNRKL